MTTPESGIRSCSAAEPAGRLIDCDSSDVESARSASDPVWPNFGSGRAGTPLAIEWGGMSDSTMLPATTTAPSPIVTPGLTVTRPANHTSLPTKIGLGGLVCSAAVAASGISTSEIMQCGPIMQRSPMDTQSAAAITVPKFMSTSLPISIRPARPATNSAGNHVELMLTRSPTTIVPSLTTLSRPATRALTPIFVQARRATWLQAN